MGAADEDRIAEAFTREVRTRGAAIKYDCDAYWLLAADVAVRLTLEDMVTQAEKWITKKPETEQWLEKLRVSGQTSEDWSHLAWIPDTETVRWWIGLATGDRIVESLEGEVKERSVGIQWHSDEYWHLVAEVAVEHLHFELYDTAIAWGTAMSDPSRPEQVEQPPPL
jgi:hypothetical protein